MGERGGCFHCLSAFGVLWLIFTVPWVWSVVCDCGISWSYSHTFLYKIQLISASHEYYGETALIRVLVWPCCIRIVYARAFLWLLSDRFNHAKYLWISYQHADHCATVKWKIIYTRFCHRYIKGLSKVYQIKNICLVEILFECDIIIVQLHWCKCSIKWASTLENLS